MRDSEEVADTFDSVVCAAERQCSILQAHSTHYWEQASLGLVKCLGLTHDVEECKIYWQELCEWSDKHGSHYWDSSEIIDSRRLCAGVR